MPILQTVFLATALSADAFVVAASVSVLGNFNWKNALALSFSFAFTQAILFSLGYFIGEYASSLALSIFPYFACFILCALGLFAIKSGLSATEGCPPKLNFNNPLSLALLSISVSIDALIAGLPYPIISSEALQSFLIVALVTFLITLCAALLSIKLRHRCKLYTLAGIALIAIGFSLLF